jgi:hypothetical protein
MEQQKVVAMLLSFLIVTLACAPIVTAQEVETSGDDQSVNERQSSPIIIVLQKDGNVTATTGAKKVSLKPIPISELKKIKIPSRILAYSVNQTKPVNYGLDSLRPYMTDLTDKEQDQLIRNTVEIINGTSPFGKDEQIKIVQKIGTYMIIAENGGEITPKWAVRPGHYELARAATENLGSLSRPHNGSLMDYAGWADDNRFQPFPPEINRHSWVLDGTGVPFSDNLGPDSLVYFINNARTDFNNYNTNSAYMNIGKGLHYLEDLGCPYHTTGNPLMLPNHGTYETWVANNWNNWEMDSVIQVDGYYVISDPAQDAKDLAAFSYQFLEFFDWEINNDPNWQTNPDMIYWTKVLNSETEKLTMGMVIYANQFKSPDTIGANSVPIQDLQMSYANINDVASSDSIVLPISITHPDPSELEIWIGARENSSSNFTYYKIWDRQSIGGNNLAFDVWATDFTGMHDWQLVVRDDVTGNEGSIDEFSAEIG